MTEPNDQLKLKLANLPTAPGVYVFKNVQGRPIYIGKAKNLRNRVRTYFQESGPVELRTRRMVGQIADLDLLVTENEIESLILESNLVHEHKPRYNIHLKDDKHFPYIKVTTDEPFPRVLIVRRLEKDKATYFGPYTGAKGMRRTLTFLCRLFKIRTCNFQIPPPPGKQLKVCLDYHINRCGGPCEGLQSQEEYADGVKAVLMFLSGRSRRLVEQLKERMQQASTELRFEEARALRDQVEALQSVMIKQNVDVGEVVDRDVIAAAREGGEVMAVVMQIREGVLIGRQEFRMAADPDDTEESILASFLQQYYNHQPNLPDEVCLPLELPEAGLVEKWLRREKGSRVEIVAPKVGQKMRLLELAAKNARLLLDEVLLQKKAVTERTSKMVTALQDDLKLQRAPRRMVCFDISNTGESDAVGSCVCFDNGRPAKSNYRHFKIKGITGQDDFTMMRQVVGRYFLRVRDEKQAPPDLVVVDGGKGQLAAATAELASLGFADQSAIGLAKRLEEVFVPGLSDPLTISRTSPGLLLLKRIRDEAHRFAVTYNRKVRSKRTIKSKLDDIPGVGPARRQALLKQFGSVKAIGAATVEEIATVKGVPRKTAEAIKAALAER